MSTIDVSERIGKLVTAEDLAELKKEWIGEHVLHVMCAVWITCMTALTGLLMDDYRLCSIGLAAVIIVYIISKLLMNSFVKREAGL